MKKHTSWNINIYSLSMQPSEGVIRDIGMYHAFVVNDFSRQTIMIQHAICAYVQYPWHKMDSVSKPVRFSYYSNLDSYFIFIYSQSLSRRTTFSTVEIVMHSSKSCQDNIKLDNFSRLSRKYMCFPKLNYQ